MTNDQLIARALRCCEKRVIGQELSSPLDTYNYLRLKVGALPYEVFGCVWLDTQHRVLHCAELFRGTVSQTAVYPREVIREAMAWNAAAVILYHNHPSGMPEPSAADRLLTESLKTALGYVDVVVLDHVIVTTGKCASFAERGWL